MEVVTNDPLDTLMAPHEKTVPTARSAPPYQTCPTEEVGSYWASEKWQESGSEVERGTLVWSWQNGLMRPGEVKISGVGLCHILTLFPGLPALYGTTQN